jgi:hypothetical protein
MEPGSSLQCSQGASRYTPPGTRWLKVCTFLPYFKVLSDIILSSKKIKAIPVTGRGGLQGCPLSAPQKHYFSASGTHFC